MMIDPALHSYYKLGASDLHEMGLWGGLILSANWRLDAPNLQLLNSPFRAPGGRAPG